jgi:hypothetical protein
VNPRAYSKVVIGKGLLIINYYLPLPPPGNVFWRVMRQVMSGCRFVYWMAISMPADAVKPESRGLKSLMSVKYCGIKRGSPC